ncbi:MAG: ATP-binding protein, partial [bacterium]
MTQVPDPLPAALPLPLSLDAPLPDTPRSKSDSPYGWLASALLLSFGALVFFGWHNADAIHDLEYSHRLIQLTALQGDMKRLDQSMVKGMELYAATGDPAREAEYQIDLVQIFADLDAMPQIDPGAAALFLTPAMDESTSGLAGIEAMTIDQVHAGHLPEAQALMGGAEYATYRAIFLSGVADVDRYIAGKLSTVQADHAYDQHIFFGALAVLIPLLVLVWVCSIRALRTWQRAMRQSEARTRLASDTSSDSIVTTDMEGLILEWNPQAVTMFGYSKEEVVGKQNVSILFPASVYATNRALFLANVRAGLRTWSHPREEVTGYHRSGRKLALEMVLAAGQIEGRYYVTGFIRDLSERKQAEAALLARDRAEEATRAKSMFLANMSHELRTPLNAILGFSDLLRMEAEESGREQEAEDLVRIHSAGRHLLALINDILDLSKIEAGKMAVANEEFATRDLLDEVQKLAVPLASMNGNRLVFESGAGLSMMHSDLTKVRQILLNLLSNACKFTENGTVTLRTRRLSAEGRDWIEFEVRDTGIGMSPDQLQRIFHEFVQADPSTTRKYGGTGLGLTLSRRFTELLGGGITVTSTLGEGSVFTAMLPAEFVTCPLPKVRAPLEQIAESVA